MTRIARAVTFLTVLAIPLAASAHFKLNAPASLSNQNSLGDPQKSDPCGQDDGNSFVLSNQVNNVQTGEMLEIDVTETVAHEGHFRIALATDMASIPADPPVTAGGGDPCNATVIDDNPTFPILADGLLPHTSKLPANSKMMVQLPAGMECQGCVIQVLQYMRNHGAPCFYHHCATLNISNNPAPNTDGPVTPPGQEAGVEQPPEGGVEGGCCSTSGGTPSGIALGMLVGALILRRRRS
ncbi:MAG: lytic polysaccharide monooxygenase [Deltaproteobacteria bacterium]|nr:lytic polysaccharide monooxygenase [Deltaproteobacteria bacterium]